MYIYNNILLRTKEKLKNDTQIIGKILMLKKFDEYNELLALLSTRYTILDTKGVVIYDSQNYTKEKNMENHSYRPEIKDLETIEYGFSLRRSRTLDKKMAYFAKKIKKVDNQEIIIRTSVEYFSQQRDIVIIIFLQILFFIILDTVILTFYFKYIKKSQIKRIEKMRLFLESGVELKETYLSTDLWLQKFWIIIQEWQNKNLENIKRLKREKILLGSLINSLDEGIILFDKELNVIRKNFSMKFLFEDGKKKYIEVIKNIEIIDILEEVQKNKIDIDEEIYLQSLDVYIFVSVKYLLDNKQYILTVKNISKEKKMINFQKKFISDVGHELKTPLTNIKGYLIAIETANEENRELFFRIVKKNVQKLENIVIDFLTISGLEVKNKIKISTIKLEDMKMELNSHLEGIIKSKRGKIVYKIDLDRDSLEINCDYEKLFLIVKNLVENGFIYNISNDPKVEIDIKEKEMTYLFRIKDNGIGIKSNEFENIFDRFYRIDMSRSSDIPGTGLGLAIVKETLGKLKGNIRVDSTLGEGTLFEFEIRKYKKYG